MNRHRVGRVAMLICCCMLVACAARAPRGPEPPAHPTPATQTGFHIVVERGQSLDRIAQTYRVAKEAIIAANNLEPPYALKPGTVLQMPLTAVQPAKKPLPKPTPTPASTTAAKPDRSTESAASAPRARPKRQPPEIIPLD